MRSLAVLSLALSMLAGRAALAAPDAPAPRAPRQPPGASVPGPWERQLIWPAEGPYRLRLRNVRGRIAVTRWPKTVAFVRATVRTVRPLDTAEQALLKEATWTVEEARPGDAQIGVAFPSLAGRHPAVVAVATPGIRVDWRIVLPPETALEVTQESGPVLAHGTDGRLNVHTRDGDVSISGASGWVEAANERGAIQLEDIEGDVIARTHEGAVTLRGVRGDVRALTGRGSTRLEVPPRWVGEVAFHTVGGEIRSDLATRHTDLQPGDRGYVGVLVGPLARPDAAAPWRVRVDSVGGDLTVATERSSAGK